MIVNGTSLPYCRMDEDLYNGFHVVTAAPEPKVYYWISILDSYVNEDDETVVFETGNYNFYESALPSDVSSYLSSNSGPWDVSELADALGVAVSEVEDYASDANPVQRSKVVYAAFVKGFIPDNDVYPHVHALINKNALRQTLYPTWCFDSYQDKDFSSHPMALVFAGQNSIINPVYSASRPLIRGVLPGKKYRVVASDPDSSLVYLDHSSTGPGAPPFMISFDNCLPANLFY